MWLLIPLFTFCLLGTTLPTIGSLWVAQDRALQANVVAYAVATYAIISSTLGVGFILKAPIFALLEVLISDRLSALAYQRSRNLLWLMLASPEHPLDANVSSTLCQSNFEDYLFGDILDTDSSDAYAAITGLILLAVLIATLYREIVFFGGDPLTAIDAGINSRRIQIELASNKWSINAAYNCIFIIRRHCCSSCSPPGHCS